MSKMSQFYDESYEKGEYSNSEYDLNRLCSIKGLQSWLLKHKTSTINVADIGCGEGRFLKDFTDRISQKWDIDFGKLLGVDFVKAPKNVFENIRKMEFVQCDFDGTKLPFDDNSFDLVTCNHVLEHIFYTENLVQEIKRILKPTGLGIISVPNLSAWINRLFLLFSIQPLGCEMGANSITYGLWLPHFKKHVADLNPAGHIRSFTPRSLCDLVENSGGGKKSLKTIGYWNQDAVRLFRITKWAGRGIGIIVVPVDSDI